VSRLRAPNQPSARRAAGLTLIELMVVVAIAVIILGLAAPSFSEYIVTQRLRSIHSGPGFALQHAPDHHVRDPNSDDSAGVEGQRSNASCPNSSRTGSA